MSINTPAEQDPFENPADREPEDPATEDPGRKPDSPTDPKPSTEDDPTGALSRESGSGSA